MSFLNQILLAGTLASAIPIIIHLLNRRRFKRVPFAAMRFVKVSVQRNQRRMQLEDWILLAVRCLLLALLAFALARPAIDWLRGNLLGGSTIATTIILDHSASMSTNGRFAQAKLAATQTVDALPEGSAAAIILSADSADTGILEPTSDLRLVRSTITNATLSDRPTDLEPAIEKALEVLARNTSTDKELVIITDGQAQGWQHFEPILKTLAAQTETRLNIVLIDAEFPAPNNLGISNLRQTSALTPTAQALRFEVQITNYATTEASQIPVTLTIDNAPAGEPFTIDTIPPGETTSVTIYAKLNSAGYHRATATIATDGMPADDTRTIILRATEAVDILLVDGQPASGETSSETFFLRNALVPVPPEMREAFFINTRTVTVADLSPNIFENQSAVVLANTAGLTPDTISALEEYVRNGGGLIIFPGSNTNLTNFNSSLSNLLPATIGEPADAPPVLQAGDYSHPITELWNDPGSGTLADATFTRALTLTLTKNSRAVLRFDNGNPAIAERDLGLGKVFLFASTADTEWNNLPVRPAFLPLTHRLLGAIVSERETGLNLQAGAQFTFKMPMELAGKESLITNSQLQSTTQKLGEDASFHYTQTDRAGAYEVSIADPPTLLQFAVQPAPEESRLDPITPAQQQRLARHAGLVPFKANTQLKEIFTRKRSGSELWLIILIGVISLAVIEMFLAQWFSREK